MFRSILGRHAGPYNRKPRARRDCQQLEMLLGADYDEGV